MNTIEKCPKCGGAEYVVRMRATGVVSQAYRFDGEDADNSGMWDNVQLRPLKVVRCRDCGARLPGMVGT